MAHSYIAYIDESGDDGLPGHFRQPGGNGGPSHWLAIGATVWRFSRDLDMVQCAKSIIGALPKPSYGAKLVPTAEKIAEYRQDGVLPADLTAWLRLFEGK